MRCSFSLEHAGSIGASVYLIQATMQSREEDPDHLSVDADPVTGDPDTNVPVPLNYFHNDAEFPRSHMTERTGEATERRFSGGDPELGGDAPVRNSSQPDDDCEDMFIPRKTTGSHLAGLRNVIYSDDEEN